MHTLERTLSITKMNLVVLALTALLIPLVAVSYGALWGGFSLHVTGVDLLLVGLASIPLIFVHEVLHAVGFIYIGKADRADVKLGIMWKSLTPYATCKAPLSICAYRWAIALPTLVLGLIPTAMGLALGLGLPTVLGTFMIMGGLGDVSILWLIRKDRDVMVLDHPTKVGCMILAGDGPKGGANISRI